MNGIGPISSIEYNEQSGAFEEVPVSSEEKNRYYLTGSIYEEDHDVLENFDIRSSKT